MFSWMRDLADSPAKARKRVVAALLSSGLPYVRDVVIPDQVGGYTQAGHLLLTSTGIVLMDVQHFRGELHGSAHTQRWIRFERGQRHEFDNPFRRLRDLQATLEQMILGDRVGVAVRCLLIVTGPVHFARGVPEGVVVECMLKPWLAMRRGLIPARQRAVWDVLLSRVACEPVAPFGTAESAPDARPSTV